MVLPASIALIAPLLPLVLAQVPVAPAAAARAAAPSARLDTRVEAVLDGLRDRLVVDVRVSGLDPAKRDLAFELPTWGDWLEIDDYYVTAVSGTPPVRHDLENRFYWRPQLPAQWDGKLALRYELPIVAFGSAAQQKYGLLPWRTGGYVHAFTINTLMRLLVGDARQDGDRHVELVAPKGWEVATGWGGLAASPCKLDVAREAENTALLFGKPVGSARVEQEGRVLDVVQFGAHVDRTAAVLELARKARAAYAATTGAWPAGDERLFITEPGLGGTHVEGAITLGHPELEADGRFETGTAHFLAHELFHAWLPGVLKPAPALADAGLEWFFEGFTDYFALWHLVHVGLVPPQRFADQLALLEQLARRSPALGKVAFADRSVHWREPGAESIAYKGGALLAFHLDARLRLQGEPGLPQLFRDLARENGSRYDLATLQQWCEANGLAESWARHVVAPELPDLAADLLSIGFREKRDGERRVITAAGADVDRFFRFDPSPR